MKWHNPLPLKLVETSDSLSFLTMEATHTGIPVGDHPGAFGYVRKNHIHEGVDLYAPTDCEVYAVESGIVTKVEKFTGADVGSPWWNTTFAVYVEGNSGTVVYGEIDPLVTEGQRVESGELVGKIMQVLKKNKGRPMSMLHLELHLHGTTETKSWGHYDEMPDTLIDPTKNLLEIVKQ